MKKMVAIIGTGVKPNTDFLKETRIRVDQIGGIIVNEESNPPFWMYLLLKILGFTGGKRRSNAIWPEAVDLGNCCLKHKMEVIPEMPGREKFLLN